MEKVFFGLIATILLSTNINSQIIKKSNLSFQNMTIDNAIGKKHNQIVLEFLIENEKIKDLSYIEKQKVVLSYLKENKDLDLFKVLNSFDLYLNNEKPNFNPFEYVSSFKKQLSEHFYNKIINVLTETSNINDISVLKELVSKYRNEALNDDEFYENEKETFVNMLYIYESSIDLWYNYNENDQNLTNRISSKHYWQIATCDFIGGISGGIFGGQVGFLVGAIGSSAQAAVCFWE